MAVDRDYWMEVAGARKADNDKLRAALCILYADCADYIRVNNLYRGDGTSAIWNQAMKQAADALGIDQQITQMEKP